MDEDICDNENLHGKWVVLLDEHIIESGDDIKLILESAKEKYPHGKLILAQVPKEGTLIY